MKIRTGFVSNSSSSSYLCEVCGESTSGFDMCMRDARMVQCVMTHEFCEEHLLYNKQATEEMREDLLAYISECLRDHIEYYEKHNKSVEDSQYCKDTREAIEHIKQCKLSSLCDLFAEEIDNHDDFRYSMPSSTCPICNFKVLTNNDLAEYMLALNKTSRAAIREQLQTSFTSYRDFKKWHKEENQNKPE